MALQDVTNDKSLWGKVTAFLIAITGFTTAYKECKISAPIQDVKKPIASFYISPEEVYINEPVKFISNSQNADFQKWFLPNGENNNDKEAGFNFFQTGAFSVKLQAFSSNGSLTDEYVQNVYVKTRTLQLAEPYLTEGQNALNDNTTDIAFSNYSKAIQLDPENCEGYYGAGTALLKEGMNYENAAYYLQKATEKGCKAAYSNLGFAYFEMAKYPLAWESFSICYKNNEHTADTFIGGAITQWVTGNRAEAIKLYEKAIKLDTSFDGDFKKVYENYFYSKKQATSLTEVYEALKKLL